MNNNGNAIRTCKDKAATPDEFSEEESENSTRNTPANNVAVDKTKNKLFHREICEAVAERGGDVYGGDDRDVFGGPGFT